MNINKELTPAEAAFVDSPMTAIHISRDHKIMSVEGGRLMQYLGVYWQDEVIGKDINEFIAPFFVNDMSEENHRVFLESYMKNPEGRDLGSVRVFQMKGNNGSVFSVKIILSGVRRIGFKTSPALMTADKIVECVTAFVIPW